MSDKDVMDNIEDIILSTSIKIIIIVFLVSVMRAIFGVEIDLTYIRSVEGIALALLLDAVDTEAGKDAISDFAWAHGVHIEELDAVAETIMDTLDCTAEAAQGMREWIFDATSDSLASLEQLRADLSELGAWYPDDDALKSDYCTYSDGQLFEQLASDEAPVPCEADVWYDASFGYLVLYR